MSIDPKVVVIRQGEGKEMGPKGIILSHPPDIRTSAAQVPQLWANHASTWNSEYERLCPMGPHASPSSWVAVAHLGDEMEGGSQIYRG
jgi:hypothetical protein